MNRSQIMVKIKSVDTIPEIKIRKALWKLGIRGYRTHFNSLIGKQDIVFVKKESCYFC